MSRARSAPAKIAIKPPQPISILNRKDVVKQLQSKMSPKTLQEFAATNKMTRQLMIERNKYYKFIQYNTQNPFHFYSIYEYPHGDIHGGDIIYENLKHIYVIDKDLKSISFRNVFSHFTYNSDEYGWYGNTNQRSYIIPKELLKTNISVENLIRMLLTAAPRGELDKYLSPLCFDMGDKGYLLAIKTRIEIDTYYRRKCDFRFYLIPKDLQDIFQRSVAYDIKYQGNAYDIIVNNTSKLRESEFKNYKIIHPMKEYKDIPKFDDIDYGAELSYKTELIDAKLYFSIFLHNKVLTFSLEDFHNKINLKRMIKQKLRLTLRKGRFLDIWYNIPRINKPKVIDEYCLMIDLKKKTITLRSILNQEDSSADTSENDLDIPVSDFKLVVSKTPRKSPKSI